MNNFIGILAILFLFFSLENINGQDALEGRNIPQGYMTYVSYPDPFGSVHRFKLITPDTSEVKVSVVDVEGNSIKEIFTGVVVNRFSTYSWEPEDFQKPLAKSGTFYFLVEATLRTTALTKMYFKSSFPIPVFK